MPSAGPPGASSPPPAAGPPRSHLPSTCPNCGTAAPGRFCPACGQEQGGLLVPTVRGWLAETLDELLLVEARLPRSLGALFWPPAHLWQEWRRGRRARYVSPLRLYLLAAVPFFLLLSLASQGSGNFNILRLIVEGSFFTLERPDMVADEDAAVMRALTPRELEDSAAVVRWQEEFERRRAARLAGSRLWQAREASAMERGMDRVFDLLPLAVGLAMVPLLAWLLAGFESGNEPFISRLVASLHIHTVTYLAAALAWPLGVGLWAAALAGGAYVAAFARRVLHVAWWKALAGAYALVVVYGMVLLALYAALVQGLVAVAPGWIFGS